MWAGLEAPFSPSPTFECYKIWQPFLKPQKETLHFQNPQACLSPSVCSEAGAGAHPCVLGPHRWLPADGVSDESLLTYGVSLSLCLWDPRKGREVWAQDTAPLPFVCRQLWAWEWPGRRALPVCYFLSQCPLTAFCFLPFLLLPELSMFQ